MKIPFEWEPLFKAHAHGVGGTHTYRAKVPGGWLISNTTYTDVLNEGSERSISESMVFVYDPEHKWEVK